MSRRFRLGLVVGKFSPLHRGHEALIRQAQSVCDDLLVVSYSNPELAGCAASEREVWLAELFPQARRLARRWGSPVAHVLIDRERVEFPISGSQIRSNVHAHRNWLSPFVYSSFVQRICLLGGESSGKSVLARAAAEQLGTVFVPEYGRELWEARAGKLVYEDMLAIATRQVEWEQSAARQAIRYLFCDTSPLTTLFYSLDLFGRADPQLQSLALRTYDTYVLCAPDFEFVQDGTRRDAAFRQKQHDWYLEQLGNRGVEYLFATGPVEARRDQIAARLARA